MESHPLETVLTSFALSLVIVLSARVATRRLSPTPGGVQALLEGAVDAMYGTVADVLPEHADLVFPFIATLWLFVGAANLLGLFPGLSSPTSNLSVTAALAILVFLSVHWFGVRSTGLREHLRHYLRPSPVLLPFHLIGELTRTLALAVRLFGNMMSLELAALLVLMVAGLLVPVPLLLLHVLEAVIQAYIFGMLALVYIAGGIQTQAAQRRKESGS